MKVLITGSSSGIGLATAKKFLQEGHEVFGLDIQPCEITDSRYHHFLCDITKDLPDIEDIEILINNAGVQEEEKAIDVNLKGNIAVTEKYIQSDKLKSVLFISSSSARNGAEFPLYCTSKGGIVTYMKNLASRLASRQVTVNSIAPGGVITPLNSHILEDEKLYAQVKAEALLNKWATAEEIADWNYFLTVVNKSMTGEDILVDNGEMLKSNFIW